MSAVAIRRAAAHDQQGIAELILPIQQQEFGIAITFEDQPDLVAIESFYQTGKGDFWIAVADGKPVGSIALKDIGNGQAALRKMFVHADYRGGAGVAAKLLNELLAHAKASGLKEVYLGTTSKYLAAHRFYEKHGFEQIQPEQLPATFPRMAVDSRFYLKRI